MRSYELPDMEYEFLGAEKAQQEVNRFAAESQADPEHPWLNRSHPQHGDFVKHFQKLTEITTASDVAAKEAEEAEIIERMQSGKSANQDELIEQAEAEMEQLVQLGFERAEIPDDIQPFQVRTLKIQRLNAERNFTELLPLLEKELKSFGPVSGSLWDEFRRDQLLDADFRAEVIELVLKRIYAANQKKAKVAKSQLEDIGE